MKNLKRIRLERGLSLRALARQVGCSYNAIHTWEHGTARPQPRNAKALREALGVPLDLLLADNEEGHRSDKNGGPKSLVTA